MKNLKMLSVGLILLLALLSLATLVSADSDLYEIYKVKVDGSTVYEVDDDGSEEEQQVSIQADDNVDVKVFFRGTGDNSTCPDGDVDDCDIEVQAHAEINGYEDGDIDDTSSVIDIEPGISYSEELTLEIPNDIDTEGDDNADGSRYTLYVEIYDDNDNEQISLDVFIERPRHNVEIYDVIYDSTVDAGDTLNVEVRLENLGEEKEEDIKVELSVAGESTAVYLDELASFEDNSEHDDEESSDSVDLQVSLDDDLDEGSYDLEITVTYDRGHESLTWVSSITVGDADDDDADEEEDEGEDPADVSVSLSTTSLRGSSVEDTSFTLTFANSGDESATYTVDVSGVSQFASVDVDPSVVIVSGGKTEKVQVTLSPDSDAEGDFDFTVQILDADGDLVEEIEMDITVEEGSSNSAWEDTGSALKLGFIILIVLIIIIGLIVAFRKLGDDDDDDLLEPKDGQTYY